MLGRRLAAECSFLFVNVSYDSFVLAAFNGKDNDVLGVIVPFNELEVLHLMII